MAGKAVLKTKMTPGGIQEKLVRISRPVACIPNLAIHIQTAEERAAFKINPELHLRPVFYSLAEGTAEGTGEIEVEGLMTKDVALSDSNRMADDAKTIPKKDAFRCILAAEAECSPDDILDYDICLMDACEGQFMGLNEEFISTGNGRMKEIFL